MTALPQQYILIFSGDFAADMVGGYRFDLR